MHNNRYKHIHVHVHTVEPLIKDTLNKGHQYILPPKEDNLSIMDKMIRPNVSTIQRFHCTRTCTVYDIFMMMSDKPVIPAWTVAVSSLLALISRGYA